MIAGHRWEYKPDLRLYECVGLPFGGVESHQWCIGCGTRVTDYELCRAGLPADGFSLEVLAKRRPIEADTLEEFRFRHKR